ncbi:hypothetical protein [Kitasatospora sp. NPDC048407]
MLSDWIAEVADEPLVLDSGDRREEWDTTESALARVLHRSDCCSLAGS